MIIVWQGLGFLGFLIPFLMSLAAQLASDSLFEKGYYSAHPLMPAVVLIIASGIVWALGEKLNGGPSQLLVDPKTGQQYEFKKKHTLFWIPLQWSSAVIAAIALYVAFK
jgi:hypothetical protein